MVVDEGTSNFFLPFPSLGINQTPGSGSPTSNTNLFPSQLRVQAILARLGLNVTSTIPTTNVDSLMEMLEIQQTLLYPEQSAPLTSAHPLPAFPPLPHLTRPLLPLILTNFHLLPPLAMAERIEPLPGAPRAMPPLSFLHSILRLMVGLPDTSSEVLATPRLPLQHTPSLDRASPQPTPSFKSEPMKRICLPGSAADPTLVEGLISGPDSLRWRLTRSLTVDDANSRTPATAMLAIQEGQLQEVVAESQLRPIVMAMTPAQLP